MILANFTPVKIIVSGLFFLQAFTGSKELNLLGVFFMEKLALNLRFLYIKEREKEKTFISKSSICPSLWTTLWNEGFDLVMGEIRKEREFRG